MAVRGKLTEQLRFEQQGTQGTGLRSWEQTPGDKETQKLCDSEGPPASRQRGQGIKRTCPIQLQDVKKSEP